MLRIFIAAAIGALFFSTSAGAFTARDKIIGYSGKMICSGPDAPWNIDLWIVYDEEEPTGYIRLGWWKHNVQYKDDINVPIDAIEKEPGEFELKIPPIPVNEKLGISGEISQEGTGIRIALVHKEWNCDATSLKARKHFPTIGATALRDLRARYTEEQVANGPSQADVQEQMTAAAAYRLCNPQGIEAAISMEAIEATGAIGYDAVANECIASMFGVPIGILAFQLTEWNCSMGSDAGSATCEGTMNLICDTPTDFTGVSGSICTSGTMDYADFFGSGRFFYDKISGKWIAEDISISGKER